MRRSKGFAFDLNGFGGLSAMMLKSEQAGHPRPLARPRGDNTLRTLNDGGGRKATTRASADGGPAAKNSLVSKGFSNRRSLISGCAGRAASPQGTIYVRNRP